MPVPAILPAPVTVEGPEPMREMVGEWRALRQTVALVPTMGNLHDGHLSLARLARAMADRVVLSIFVNPTQFGPGEDFAAYPRTLEQDIARLADEGAVDAVYVPTEQEIYPFGLEEAVRFVLPPISRELCGASRPGHFDGVASVVCRLLNIVAPHTLVLGRKDYQQLIIIERLVADLNLPVRVASGPTVRQADGLALSSRNHYLTAKERQRAPQLNAALEKIREAMRGGRRDYAALAAETVAGLQGAGFKPDYVEVRRAKDLGEVRDQDTGYGQRVVLGAVWLGKTRLIDNVAV